MAQPEEMNAECKKKLITVVFRDTIEKHLKPTDGAILLMLQNQLISLGELVTYLWSF